MRHWYRSARCPRRLADGTAIDYARAGFTVLSVTEDAVTVGYRWSTEDDDSGIDTEDAFRALVENGLIGTGQWR